MPNLITVVIECDEGKDQAAVGAHFIGFFATEKGHNLEGRCVGAYVGDAVGRMMEFEEKLIDNDIGVDDEEVPEEIL